MGGSCFGIVMLLDEMSYNLEKQIVVSTNFSQMLHTRST